MALTPELQSLCEFRLIDATHAVITNARPDHLDVMGPHAGDVARALAGMTPRGTKLYTAERQQLEVLRAAALDRKSTLITVDERDVAALTPEEMSRFRYREHPENVALALRVVEDLGVTRDVALLGMWKTEPDPGALTRHQVDFFGRTVVFYNGFAANDPISTEKLWALAIEENPDLLTRVAIVNCRADRPDRSLRLGEGFMRLKPPSFVVLMGSGTYVFAQAALRAGLDAGRLVFMENQNVEEIFERVMSLVERSAVIMGMGNTGGHGLDLSRYFSNRALPPGAAS
jgi:poly-gamma-glutamate synthase PgsB/CapB